MQVADGSDDSLHVALTELYMDHVLWWFLEPAGEDPSLSVPRWHFDWAYWSKEILTNRIWVTFFDGILSS